MTDTSLVEVSDADFEWMIRREAHPHRGLRLPPGGVEEPEILEHVRGIVARLREQQCPAGWMIVSGGEVIGLCSYKRAPSPDGEVEIGYGIAASRRNRGHATRALAALLERARRDPAVRLVVAGTDKNNVASQRVLERNGFLRAGECLDPNDGQPIVLWKNRLKP